MVVVNGADPVPDGHVLEAGTDYEARLIEGYDLTRFTDLYDDLYRRSAPTAYVWPRISFDADAHVLASRVELTLDDLATEVEQRILETCLEFDLLEPEPEADCGVLVGLSGGVDSTALLLALTANADRLPAHRIVAATFEDFDSQKSTVQARAKQLASDCGIPHITVGADRAQNAFHLSCPLSEALTGLMETADAHKVMYIDHHTTRRVLEVVAVEEGLDRIALGLHVSDLVAGLLNSWFTGYDVAPVPRRRIGDLTYIYPLAFINKKQLHLYYRQRTGGFATHAHPNAWELHPQDRNFYYYLADVMQQYWPGLEVFLYSAHRWRGRRQAPLVEEHCVNCGSTLLHQPFTPVDSDWCDVCQIFERHGYIDREAL